MTVSELERRWPVMDVELELRPALEALIADWQAMRAVLTVIQTEPECIPHKIAEGVLFGLKLKP